MSQLIKQSSHLFSRLQGLKQISCFSTTNLLQHGTKEEANPSAEEEKKGESERVVKFRNKLRAKTPLGKLDELSKHPYQEKEPLKPWPNNKNPHTGEVGGPAGPEPTRYGDWERKGRVTDF